MDLIERVIFLAIGGGIGFILGYIVALLRETKEEVHEVLDMEKHRNDERGAVSLNTVAVVLVVLLTAVAAFATAKVNSRLDETLSCITQYNVHQGEALNSRDKAIKAGTDSEIELWTKYGQLYAQAKKDPTKIPQAQEALNQAIMSHRDALEETQASRFRNPYPNPNVLQDCKENAK